MQITKTETFNIKFASNYCRKDCDCIEQRHSRRNNDYCKGYHVNLKKSYSDITTRCQQCIEEFGLGDEKIPQDNIIPLTEEELLAQYKEYLKLFNGTSKCPMDCKRLIEDMGLYWCEVQDIGIRTNPGITRTDECAYNMKKKGFSLYRIVNNKL